MATTEIFCKSPTKSRKFADLANGALFFKSGDLSTPFRKNHHDIDPDMFNASELGCDHNEDIDPEDSVVLIVRATFEAEQ